MMSIPLRDSEVKVMHWAADLLRSGQPIASVIGSVRRWIALQPADRRDLLRARFKVIIDGARATREVEAEPEPHPDAANGPLNAAKDMDAE